MAWVTQGVEFFPFCATLGLWTETLTNDIIHYHTDEITDPNDKNDCQLLHREGTRIRFGAQVYQPTYSFLI